MALCALMIVPTRSVNALTRQQECDSYRGESGRADCIAQLNLDAWTACAGQADPGRCADEYRNGTAGDSGSGGGGTPTSTGGTAPVEASTEKDCTGDDLSQDCKIVEWLVLFVNVLSGMVGVVVVIMIIVGGIQYTASGDDPQAVAKAKGKIYNAVLALVLFIFGFTILQWVIPGGLL